MRAQSQQARAAKEIRGILKQNYPDTKFSVTSAGYSMGDNVNVNWTDGPRDDEVKSLICQYQYGHFNGMEDIYENTNSRDDIPQTKYLFCDRTHGLERRQAAVNWLNQNTSVECYIGDNGEICGNYSSDWNEWPSAIVFRMLNGHYTHSNPEMDFSKALVEVQ